MSICPLISISLNYSALIICAIISNSHLLSPHTTLDPPQATNHDYTQEGHEDKDNGMYVQYPYLSPFAPSFQSPSTPLHPLHIPLSKPSKSPMITARRSKEEACGAVCRAAVNCGEVNEELFARARGGHFGKFLFWRA